MKSLHNTDANGASKKASKGIGVVLIVALWALCGAVLLAGCGNFTNSVKKTSTDFWNLDAKGKYSVLVEGYEVPFNRLKMESEFINSPDVPQERKDIYNAKRKVLKEVYEALQQYGNYAEQGQMPPAGLELYLYNILIRNGGLR